MCRIRNSCPRCGDKGLVRIPGGVQCVLCGYEEVEDSLSIYSELMSTVPGAPLPNTRLGRHEAELSRTLRRDCRAGRPSILRLAEKAAQRYGVLLEDLRVDMRNSTSIPSPIRWAFQAVISDLAMSGLGDRQIANVLHKARGTIRKSSGLARGRARRKQAILHREAVEVMSEYKGRTPNTIVRRRAG